jgi:hypothetical protein
VTLQADLIAAIQTLGTAAESRVHDEQVPQGVQLPFVALTELSGTQPMDISGRGLLRRSTIRLAVFARSAVERDAVAETIRARAPAGLQAFSGLMGSTKVSSIRIEPASGEVALSDGDNVIKGKGLDLFIVYY